MKRKGYISLEIMVVCFAILTAGIGGVAHFSKESKTNQHVMVEKQEEVYYAAWNGQAHNPSGGGNVVIPENCVDFVVTADNRHMVGYTDETTILNIPATFYDSETDTNYKVVGIGSRAFYNCLNLKEISIPSTVKTIGNYAFAACRNATKISIPDSITYIDEAAFKACNSLTSLNIPSGVTQITTEAFRELTSLTELHIPNTVTHIWPSAFRDLTNVKEIIIPESVVSIGNNAFKDADSITEITIPGNIKVIPDFGFSTCDNLEKIIIEEGVEEIKEPYAFNWAGKLTTVVMPKSLKKIGGGAFYYSTNLSEIYYAGTEDEWNNIEKGTNWNFGACQWNPSKLKIHYESTGI